MGLCPSFRPPEGETSQFGTLLVEQGYEWLQFLSSRSSYTNRAWVMIKSFHSPPLAPLPRSSPHPGFPS